MYMYTLIYKQNITDTDFNRGNIFFFVELFIRNILNALQFY